VTSERAAVVWSFVYHGALMASYYILRPIRDQFGIEGGPEKLPGLFIASLLIVLAVNPIYSFCVSRIPRARLVPLVYRFFALNIFVFWVALRVIPPEHTVAAGYVFFLWVSVFNLLAVAVFWSFMADLFTTEQGKRLFGVIAAGASVGQLVGSGITAVGATRLGAVNLLLISMVLLEGATYSARRLVAMFGIPDQLEKNVEKKTEESGAREALEGIRMALASPYLLAISAYMLLYTFTSSFLYFEKGFIVTAAIPVRDERAQFFAQVALIVGSLTFAVQMFMTRAVIARLGVAGALTLVPGITIAGFAALATSPTLWVYAAFEAVRSTVNYAVARPARETLYTLVSREERYKAKAFIDTFVYRAGDGLAAAASGVLALFAVGLAGTALAAIPVAFLWLANAVRLGRAAGARVAASEERR
jgi:AAA family ATP:ADP antiporter